MTTNLKSQINFRPSAVIFDLDGTLVDTNINFTDMKTKTVELCVSAGGRKDALEFLDILRMIESTAENLDSVRAEGFRTAAWKMLEEIEMQYVPEAKAFPGANRLLDGLKKNGCKIGIVTRNCRRALSELLKLLPDVMDAVFAREDVTRVKPDPVHIHSALQALDSRPENTLMVGDHRMDIQAGRSAGARTAGVLHGRKPDIFLPEKPDYIFEDLNRLANALLDPHR